MISRPRPRLTGNENPAFAGKDIRQNIPMLSGQDQSVVQPKLASGMDKARIASIKSSRAAAARNLMTRNNNG